MNNIFRSIIRKRTKFKFTNTTTFTESIMNYYAVAKGRNPGIYATWDECKAQVHQFSGPVYKKFNSKSEAEKFIKERSSLPTPKPYFLNYRNSSSSSKRLFQTKSNGKDEDSERPAKRTKFITSSNSGLENKDKFIVDQDGYTEVYTDGACSGNGIARAKAGVGVWFYDNCPLNVSEPVIGRATNNMAEIQAVTIAARQAHKAGITKLKISTDSQFLLSCITKWMPKWKKCGWKTVSGKPVINKTELIEMENALTPLTVSWNHVRGHAGIYGNEMADKLARAGSERYKTN